MRVTRSAPVCGLTNPSRAVSIRTTSRRLSHGRCGNFEPRRRAGGEIAAGRTRALIGGAAKLQVGTRTVLAAKSQSPGISLIAERRAGATFEMTIASLCRHDRHLVLAQGADQLLV